MIPAFLSGNLYQARKIVGKMWGLWGYHFNVFHAILRHVSRGLICW